MICGARDIQYAFIDLADTAGHQQLFDGGGASTGGQLGTVTTVGQPLGEFYGYKVIGIFQTADQVNGYKDKNGLFSKRGSSLG